ncbi:MAG: S-methyl-5-thioribose kinase [Frankia sp.]
MTPLPHPARLVEAGPSVGPSVGAGVTATARERPYELLTLDTVGRYALERGHLAGATPGELAVREVGDGNLNAVFVVRAGDRGVAVKQALPYVRVHGPSWPMTPRRADAEARAYRLMTRLTPDLVPAFHGYDPDRYALVLEDLSDHRVLRAALADGGRPPGVGGRIGLFSGLLTFGTSTFSLPPADHAALVARFANPDLCALTEAMIFDEPYVAHEHNRFAAGAADQVRSLRADRAFRAAVGRLKDAFTGRSDALVHGDLHTGSVMVGGPGAGPDLAVGASAGVRGATVGAGAAVEAGRVLAFDPEFCFVGPFGFDLGLFIANLLLAALRSEVVDGSAAFRDYIGDQIVDAWAAFAGEIRRRWPERRDRTDPDSADRTDPDPDSADQTDPDGQTATAGPDRWLATVWSEVAGFAGLEALRRLIGYAHLPEIDALPADDQLAITTRVLTAGRTLVLARDSFTGPAALLTVAGLR